MMVPFKVAAMDLVLGDDGRLRCGWGVSAPEYVEYHDNEWGFPVAEDNGLFEKLCLEGFQSGLSWLTILRKREAFRSAFHGFEIERVAAMTLEEVEQLLGNPQIVRHRGKIESTVNNAKCALKLGEEVGSLATFFWGFEPQSSDPSATQAPESVALSKALKRRGFTWTGPTTAYAFMQAMGLVNDHIDGCYVRELVESRRSAFRRP